jgi:hypothetical protein
MVRTYIFCEGKRDRLFLKRLIEDKKGITPYEIERERLDDLDDLLRCKHFEGVALVECGGFITMLQNAARRSRDLASQPRVLPNADIFVVGDSDKVSKASFMQKLDGEIRKLRHKNPILNVREEGNERVLLENLKEQGYTLRVFVLTVPNNLENQLADGIRRLFSREVKELNDDDVVRFYCDRKYGCDEEGMMAEDVDVVGPLLDSAWAKRIVDLIEDC